jgi:hypothetical protein
MLLQRSEKFSHVVLGDIFRNPELVTDLAGDVLFAGSGLQQFQNPRSNDIEVEHLTLTDVEHNCAIPPMGGSHLFFDPVHCSTVSLP